MVLVSLRGSCQYCAPVSQHNARAYHSTCWQLSEAQSESEPCSQMRSHRHTQRLVDVQQEQGSMQLRSRNHPFDFMLFGSKFGRVHQTCRAQVPQAKLPLQHSTLKPGRGACALPSHGMVQLLHDGRVHDAVEGAADCAACRSPRTEEVLGLGYKAKGVGLAAKDLHRALPGHNRAQGDGQTSAQLHDHHGTLSRNSSTLTRLG
mmetsp:Transcript_155101/g.497311  ORF Transcript_155101/g.497311 Transcript_155101/m.497311 type:complete len:204 (-) Transcript_155101:60-671(-)